MSFPLDNMPESDFYGRVLSSASQLLGIGQTVASFTPLPFLPGVFTALKEIVGTVQTMRENKGAFKGLAEEATGLISILTHRFATKVNRNAEIEASIKDLHDTLLGIVRFAGKQRERSRLVRFALSGEDQQQIKNYRDEIQRASDRFKLRSLIDIHSQLSEIVSMLMRSELKKYEEADKAIQERNNKVFELLKTKRDPGASHDSLERDDVAKCLPRTREEILYRIQTWLRDPQTPHRFLWMNGSAGSGKTSIAQSIADILDKSDRLAASFFWSRSGAGRPTTNKKFVATICFQLCKVIPGLIDYVASALEHDPGLFDLKISKQMEQSVVLPLNNVHEADSSFGTSQGSWLLLADGLDECSGEDSQTGILDILLESLQRLSFPLRVLVSSRGDHAISASLKHHTKVVDVLSLEGGAEKDIRILFDTRFSKIRDEHSHLESFLQWPTNIQVDNLVRRSAGLFIYADVVMKYIELPGGNPKDTLEEVLNIGDHVALAALDAMYANILMKVSLKYIDKAIWDPMDHVDDLNLSWALCDTLLDFSPDATALSIKSLSSVIQFPSETNYGLGFFHESFPDFLKSRDRLQQYNLESFHCDVHIAHARFANSWVSLYAQHQKTFSLQSWPNLFLSQGVEGMPRYNMYQRLSPKQKCIGNILGSIEGHCQQLLSYSKLFSNKDLIHILQNLDLRVCFSLSECGSEIWWREALGPAIAFVKWLIYLPTPDSGIFRKSPCCEGFIDNMQEYWSQFSTGVRVNIPTLTLYHLVSTRGIKLPSHPIYSFYILYTSVVYGIITGQTPTEIAMHFDGTCDPFYYPLKEGSNRLAIWLIENMNIEQNIGFNYDCTPFIHIEEIPDILALMILPNLRTAYDNELVNILQDSLLKLQCRDYNEDFHRFYEAAKDFVERAGHSLSQPDAEHRISTSRYSQPARSYDPQVLDEGFWRSQITDACPWGTNNGDKRFDRLLTIPTISSPEDSDILDIDLLEFQFDADAVLAHEPSATRPSDVEEPIRPSTFAQPASTALFSMPEPHTAANNYPGAKGTGMELAHLSPQGKIGASTGSLTTRVPIIPVYEPATVLEHLSIEVAQPQESIEDKTEGGDQPKTESDTTDAENENVGSGEGSAVQQVGSEGIAIKPSGPVEENTTPDIPSNPDVPRHAAIATPTPPHIDEGHQPKQEPDTTDAESVASGEGSEVQQAESEGIAIKPSGPVEENTAPDIPSNPDVPKHTPITTPAPPPLDEGRQPKPKPDMTVAENGVSGDGWEGQQDGSRSITVEPSGFCSALKKQCRCCC